MKISPCLNESIIHKTFLYLHLCFVRVDALNPRYQFFSHVEMISYLSGLNQY